MVSFSAYTEVLDTTIIINLTAGLSPDTRNLDQITTIDRKRETPGQGAMCDLVWSDPEIDIEKWQVSQRGAGWLFGKTVCREVSWRMIYTA